MTEKTQPFSNIFLFYGEDGFSLARKLEHWKTEFAKKYTASAVTVIEAKELPEMETIKSLQMHLSPSLFASKKLIIVQDGLPTKATQTQLSEYLLNVLPSISKDFFVIFAQSQKPDGRLGFTKRFTSLVTVNEFDLPHGPMLNQWIKAMTKSLGATITDRAADKLAVFAGRDLFEEKKAGGRVIERKEAYNLWQVHSELLKLTTLTQQIDISEVEGLVKPKIPDSVFNLTDQVVAHNQTGAFQALENFLANQTTEEKTALVKIIALLSEQLRSLLVVSLLTAEGLDNDAIADRLGWTSGRVFIIARNLKNTSPDSLKLLLKRLLLIDSKIKTSDTNEKLDLDLFLVQATA